MIGAAQAALLSPPPRRYLLRHTFSGASLTPSDVGPSFTTAEGTASVSGGVLGKSGSGACAVLSSSLGASNVVAQCLVNFGNSAGTDRRMSLRMRDDGSGNLIEARLSPTANDLQLWRRDAGAVTVLSGTGSLGLLNSTNYWLRVSAIGSRIEAWTSTDGATWTSRLTVTEALYVTNQRVSVRLVDNVASPTVTIDDLLVWTP